MKFIQFPKTICYVNPAAIQKISDLNQKAKVPSKDQKYAFRNQTIDSQRLNGKRYAGLIVPEAYISVRKTQFQDDIHVRALIDRFEYGKPWIDTAYGSELFDGWYKSIIQGAYKDRTFQEFENHRLKEWDDIFCDIKENGFRASQNVLDNIEVAISSDGTVLFVDGRHRLYFAQLLKIEQIPVIINYWSIDFIRKYGTFNGNKLREKIRKIQFS